MNRIIIAALSGLIFGTGLAISGGANPAVANNMFDVLGQWDPMLALVVASAIVVGVVSFRLILRRQAPLLAANFTLPTRTAVDKRLLIGASIFGVGWGMSGFCIGPALVSFPTAPGTAALFIAPFILGVLVYEKLIKPKVEGYDPHTKLATVPGTEIPDS